MQALVRLRSWLVVMAAIWSVVRPARVVAVSPDTCEVVRDSSVVVDQVPMSVLASALSVATYLGAPAEAYGGNLTYLLSNLGTVLALVAMAMPMCSRVAPMARMQVLLSARSCVVAKDCSCEVERL